MRGYVEGKRLAPADKVETGRGNENENGTRLRMTAKYLRIRNDGGWDGIGMMPPESETRQAGPCTKGRDV